MIYDISGLPLRTFSWTGWTENLWVTRMPWDIASRWNSFIVEFSLYTPGVLGCNSSQCLRVHDHPTRRGNQERGVEQLQEELGNPETDPDSALMKDWQPIFPVGVTSKVDLCDLQHLDPCRHPAESLASQLWSGVSFYFQSTKELTRMKLTLGRIFVPQSRQKMRMMNPKK